MNSSKSKKHVIDIIFPSVLVIIAFTVSIILVLLLATNVYNSVSNRSTAYANDTAIAYITDKIHDCQIDNDDNIYAENLDGHEAIVIRQVYTDGTFNTYLYEADGSLRELTVADGNIAIPSQGSRIMAISSMKVEEIYENVYRITCTSTDGVKSSTIISSDSE